MKKMTGIRLSLPTDCQILSPRLRQADKNEIMAALGEQPEAALIFARRNSADCGTILINGVVSGMFGVTIGGVVWLVATDDLPKAAKTFLRESKRIISEWLTKFPKLGNVVDERNTLHIKWLKHMGFAFTGKSYTLHDPSVKFLEFYLCASPHS